MNFKLLHSSVELARQVAALSPDPYKKVGCVGLNSKGQVNGLGYNTVHKSVSPEFWEDREQRRPFMLHAEQVMIADRGHNGRIETVVITLFPCIQCMCLLAAHGVKKVYYGEIYEKDLGAIKVAEFYSIELKKFYDIVLKPVTLHSKV